MRRLKQTLLALTICTLVISCSLTTSSTIMKVQRGMSQEEVSHLLGKPDFRRFDNGSEQWEYTKTNMSTAANTVIIIDFVDGMVTLSVGVVNNYFTCKQTARLMSIFTWDDEKMKVLRMISNRIVDRENGKEIIKTLDSLFKQDDARKILGITNQW